MGEQEQCNHATLHKRGDIYECATCMGQFSAAARQPDVAPQEKLRALIEAVARDAVQLAIVRNSLTWDDAEELTEEQIAQDAADAIYGDGTCADGEPLESVKKLEMLLSTPASEKEGHK